MACSSFLRSGLPIALATILQLALPAAGHGASRSEATNAAQYTDCMAKARSAPEDALETARAWEKVGGAEPARHCAAVALIGLGRYAEAGQELEKLARQMPKDKADIAVKLLAQAGQAWVGANDTKRAYAAQTAALKLQPKNVDLLVDRAETLGLAQNYWEAIDDLNEAHELAPKRAEILVYRATAYRFVDSLDLARDDIEQAIRLDPKNPDAYLERGILRRLADDDSGAREDWLKVVQLGAGTPAAEAAQANLEKLDVKTQ